MTYFPDLAPYTYGGGRWREHKRLTVGWLEPGHDYSCGPVAPEVRAKLIALMPFATGLSLGSHYCEFCLGGPSPVWASPSVPHGGHTLSVPGRQATYITPELVTHYIDAHGYQPPDEFCKAVRACPLGWTDEYALALQLANPDMPFDLERYRKYTAVAICAAVVNSSAEPEDARQLMRGYADLVLSAPRIDDLDLDALLTRSRGAEDTAIEQLTHAYLHLMIRICKGYEGRGPRLIQLIDRGHVALSRATLTFDGSGDFATYVSSRIREALELGIGEHGRNQKEVAAGSREQAALPPGVRN